MEMDEHLKRLMRQLGVAINESLTDSPSVSEALAELREAGYDIFVILEATIGFNRRTVKSAAEPVAPVESGDLVLNAEDAQFLRSLRITLGADSEAPPAQDP